MSPEQQKQIVSSVHQHSKKTMQKHVKRKALCVDLTSHVHQAKIHLLQEAARLIRMKKKLMMENMKVNAKRQITVNKYQKS